MEYKNFSEINEESKLVEYLKQLNEFSADNIDYKKITDNMRTLSDSDYAILNIFEENGKEFTTKAISGLNENLSKITKILGFDILNKKWNYDPVREQKIKDSKITFFKNMHHLSENSISTNLIKIIEKTFNIGNLVLVKTNKNNIMVGDFTLIYKKNKSFKNKSLVEIYSDLVGMTITRIRSEQKIIENERRFRSLFEQTHDAVFILDLNGVHIEANEKACEMLGYTKEEIKNISFKNTSAESQKSQNIYEKLLKGEIVKPYERKIKKKDGSIIYVEANVELIKDTNNNPIHIQSVLRDISERKEHENVLKKQYKTFELISNISYDFIKSNIKNINEYLEDSFEKVANFIKADKVFLSEFSNNNKSYDIIFEKIINKKDQNKILLEIENIPLFMEALKKDNYYISETQIFSDKTNEEKNLFICYPFFRDEKIKGFICYQFLSKEELNIENIYSLQLFSEIITNAYIKKQIQEDLVKAKQEAEKANKAKSLFLSKITHDLKTPLNAILGFAEILKNDNLNEQQKEYISYILSSSNNMVNLVMNLLDISKIDSNKLMLSNDLFIFEESIINLIKSIQILFTQKNNNMIINIEENVPKILSGDSHRLNRVIQNLLSNSNKFTKDGKIELKISLENENEQTCKIKFKISDTGIGIEKEKLQNLFTLYYQAHDFNGEGTGLGLPLCKELVELMSGEIFVESDIGKGTTVTFTATFEKV